MSTTMLLLKLEGESEQRELWQGADATLLMDDDAKRFGEEEEED